MLFGALFDGRKQEELSDSAYTLFWRGRVFSFELLSALTLPLSPLAALLKPIVFHPILTFR